MEIKDTRLIHEGSDKKLVSVAVYNDTPVTAASDLKYLNNSKVAWAYIQELALKGATPVEHDVQGIHARLFLGIDDINAGRYRTTQAAIRGSQAELPQPVKIPTLMIQFGKRLADPEHHRDPVAHAAVMHYELVSIHPFTDGNGRTARLIMNLLLMLANYRPAIITSRHRRLYLRTLEYAHITGDTAAFENFINQTIGTSRGYSYFTARVVPASFTAESIAPSCDAIRGRRIIMEKNSDRSSMNDTADKASDIARDENPGDAESRGPAIAAARRDDDDGGDVGGGGLSDAGQTTLTTLTAEPITVVAPPPEAPRQISEWQRDFLADDFRPWARNGGVSRFRERVTARQAVVDRRFDRAEAAREARFYEDNVRTIINLQEPSDSGSQMLLQSFVAKLRALQTATGASQSVLILVFSGASSTNLTDVGHGLLDVESAFNQLNPAMRNGMLEGIVRLLDADIRGTNELSASARVYWRCVDRMLERSQD